MSTSAIDVQFPLGSAIYVISGIAVHRARDGMPAPKAHRWAVGVGSDTRDLYYGAAGDIDREQDMVCHQSVDRADIYGSLSTRFSYWRYSITSN